MLIQEHKQKLVDLREQWVATWDEYSRDARLAAGHALVDLLEQGTTITELGQLWGTSDRRTVMDLMQATGRYAPRSRKPAQAHLAQPAPSNPAQARPRHPAHRHPTQRKRPLAWAEGKTYVKTTEGNTVTVRVPDVTLVPWSEKAAETPPLEGSATATWDDGLFVEGDLKLQAEKKAGNLVL